VFPVAGDPGGQYVDMGDTYNTAGFAFGNLTTRAIEGTVEGSIGGSDNWVTVISLTTGNTTGTLLTTTGLSSGRTLFDKLRVNLIDNETTNTTPAWLSAGNI
jgi:hypothetical protein